MGGQYEEGATGVERNTAWLSVSAAPQVKLYMCQVVRRAEEATELQNIAHFSSSTFRESDQFRGSHQGAVADDCHALEVHS